MAKADRAMSPTLHRFKSMVAGSVRSNDPDLTTRQLAVLLIVHLEDVEHGHTVRGLAKQLNVSRAAITRAADRLCELKYVIRKDDPKDRRSVLIDGTKRGADFLRAIDRYAMTDAALAASVQIPAA